MRRVVVTGLGLVAPGGNNVPDAWRRVLGAQTAVGPITQFDATEIPVKLAAEVRDFDPTVAMPLKEARQRSRFIQFAVVAAREAMADSGLEVAAAPERYGCTIGVGLGGFLEIEQSSLVLAERGARRVSPLLIPYAIPNMASGVVSVVHGLQGPNISTTTACASGAHAIGEAYLHIGMGLADAVLSGGVESVVTPLCVSAFARMKALSENPDPATASRPFDKDRDGFVIGEGGGLMVLEELEHAQRRGAKIYAELVGYGLSADAYHITNPPPEGEGAQRCMRGALSSAKINAADLDYINAHGTSTPVNDRCESAAIAAVFGDDTRIAISSTKGVTGHLLGGAGALEAVFTVLALQHGIVPPTANYRTPDPECPLDYTPGEPRQLPLRYAMSNSFGFGGQNASLLFRI